MSETIRRSRGRWTGALALAVLAASIAFAESAGATFSPWFNVTPPESSSSTPDLASDADGDTIVVWGGYNSLPPGQEFLGYQARKISAAGTLGSVIQLAPVASVIGPIQVAADADGDAVAVWQHSNPPEYRIQGRTISASGALGPIRFLTPAGQNNFVAEVASDANGGAYVTWLDPNHAIRLRTISAAGVVGPSRILATGASSPPLIASGADGDAVAVWLKPDANGDTRIQARTVSSTGTLGAIKILSVGGGFASAYPGVAVDADGNAIVSWAGNQVGQQGQVQTRRLSDTGVLSPTKTLSTAGFDPKITTDADGDAIAIWRNAVGVGLSARAVSKTDALGPVAAVGAGADKEITSDGLGGGIAVWSRFDGSNERVQARTISSAGVLGTLKNLSAVGRSSILPQVESDLQGDAVAIWEGSDGTYQRVQASRGP